LQPKNDAVSAEILNATACFPIAPGAGTGKVFYIHISLLWLNLTYMHYHQKVEITTKIKDERYKVGH
jgi:hypothetical protein